MSVRSIGRLLLALGLLVGLVASVGLLIGFQPSRLPPALLDLAAYKLAFAAALALLAAGAMLKRHGQRSASASLARGESAPSLTHGEGSSRIHAPRFGGRDRDEAHAPLDRPASPSSRAPRDSEQ